MAIATIRCVSPSLDLPTTSPVSVRRLKSSPDGLWQKFEVVGASGYLSQGANEILVGLGQNQRADIVRMLWPTGVLQDELDVALDKPVSFTELDRRGSSCPTLFAWNGKKYEFVSDVIGAAVIGHWISPTEKNTADPDEWLKIDGRQLQPKAGIQPAFRRTDGRSKLCRPAPTRRHRPPIRYRGLSQRTISSALRHFRPNRHGLSSAAFTGGRVG